MWTDFETHRKAKRAPLTQAAVDGLGREIARACHHGLTVDDCLTEAMLRGWQGIKADWLTRDMPQNQQGGGQPQRAGKFDPNAFIEERRRKRNAESQGGGDVVDV